YDLKKFAVEIPQGAHEFVKKALENIISGSYRSAITLYRDNWKRKAEILDSTKIVVITIKDIAKDGNLLNINGSRCGTKKY
ncbi:chromosome partitioning protein ParB, partial [Francisella tularensis subsp. holarctica]|uniref:KorB domain-containing protein n=1 Tax=Francisella tularensis TaxID=263 RepID=UPI0023819507